MLIRNSEFYAYLKEDFANNNISVILEQSGENYSDTILMSLNIDSFVCAIVYLHKVRALALLLSLKRFDKRCRQCVSL